MQNQQQQPMQVVLTNEISEHKDPKEMTVQELSEYIAKHKQLCGSSVNDYDYVYNVDGYDVNNNNNGNNSEYVEDKEMVIFNLRKKNQDLQTDIKHLFKMTDQNKKELEKYLEKLSEDNFELKKQIFNLKNKIVLQDNIIKNLEVDKTHLEQETAIIKQKYQNEIIELNSQLNDYKSHLNSINFEYQNLLHNYHQLKEAVILEQIKPAVQRHKQSTNHEEQKQPTIEEMRNLKEYILQYDTNINEIKNKLAQIEHHQQHKPIHTTNTNNYNGDNSNNTSFSCNKIKHRKSKSKTPLKRNKSNSKFNYTGSINKTAQSKLKHSLTNSSSGIKNGHTCTMIKQKDKKTGSNMNGNTLTYIENEINNLERKIAELNVSYQTFLSNLKVLYNNNNNFKESQELKQTLRYLENTIRDKNEKLIQLKEKQQNIIKQSYNSNSNINSNTTHQKRLYKKIF